MLPERNPWVLIHRLSVFALVSPISPNIHIKGMHVKLTDCKLACLTVSVNGCLQPVSADGWTDALWQILEILFHFVDVWLTCRHKEDPCAEDDVVAWLVELTGSYTQASHEEQDDAEDGEDAGGSHRTWKSVEDGGNDKKLGRGRRMENGMWFGVHTEGRTAKRAKKKVGEMVGMSINQRERQTKTEKHIKIHFSIWSLFVSTS